MKLFEFDIAWDQTINTVFDQDDVKTTGHHRVETDNVHVLASDAEMAQLALSRAFTYRNLAIRTPVREIPIHIIVSYEARTITTVHATRSVGPEILNKLGEAVKSQG